MHTASLAGPASALPLHDLRRTLHSARPLWVSTVCVRVCVCVHLSTESRTPRRPALHLLASSRRLLTSLQMDYLGRYITLHRRVCGCACKLRCNSRLAAAAFAPSVERGRVTALAPSLPSLIVSCVPCRHSADLHPVAKGTKSRSARPGASIMACAAFLAARMASRAALVLPHVLGAPVRAYPRFLCSPAPSS
jgi:hypothetical protein